MVQIKEVSKGAALLLGRVDFQAAFLGKPHKRMPFLFLVSTTSETVALLQKQYVILSTVHNFTDIVMVILTNIWATLR